MNRYHATMFFFAAIDGCEQEKPYYSTIPFSAPGAMQSNYGSVEKGIEVEDIRGNEGHFSLDTHGFEVADHSTTFQDWRDGAKVKLQHYPEMATFLKTKLQADEVIIFDHSVSPETRSQTHSPLAEMIAAATDWDHQRQCGTRRRVFSAAESSAARR